MKICQHSVLTSFFSLLILSSPSNAQVVPDTSLNTNVTLEGNTTVITGGTTSGSNLFHSFQQFSILTGNQAYFNNFSNIQNIFSRITGKSISNIDGIIKDNGANLYILNPNGIIFGSNARLNIGGSFFATTANDIKFTDESVFGISQFQPKSILSGTSPGSLIFENTPGAIVVRGNGSYLTANSGQDLASGTVVIDGLSTTGLIVKPGTSISLIGGEVDLNGGLLTSRGGQITIGSFSNGEVKIIPYKNGWILDGSTNKQTSNINLSNKALIDVSGSGGAIQLLGNDISIVNGSAVINQNQGQKENGTITITATGNLFLSGTDANGTFPSVIGTQTLTQGYAGDLIITAKDFEITDGARLYSVTFSSGSGGKIYINTSNSFIISGISPLNSAFNSTLVTFSSSSGSSNDIFISSPNITIQNSGYITSISLDMGNASNIYINSNNLKLLDTSISNNSITSVTFGSGKSGNIIINTHLLYMLNSLLATNTFSSGDAGIIEITSDKMNIINSTIQSSASPNSITPYFQKFVKDPLDVTGKSGNIIIKSDSFESNNSNISSVTFDFQDGGTIQIKAHTISFDNNTVISASSFSSGESGNISIDADNISLSKSYIFSIGLGTGDGGEIKINTGIFNLLDSGISTNSLPSSVPGNIFIFANQINLSNSIISSAVVDNILIRGTEIIIPGTNIVIPGYSILDLSLFNLTPSVEIAGTGGNINIDTYLLFLDNNSKISTSSQGISRGGNIFIDTNFIIADSSSAITANSLDNFGGNITINTEGAVIAPGFVVSATSSRGAQFDGRVTINSNTILPAINPPTPQHLSNLPSVITCDPLTGRLAYVGTGGMPGTLKDSYIPDDFLKSEPVQTSLFYTDPETGKKHPFSDAVGWKDNPDGTISFVTDANEAVQYAEAKSQCSQSQALQNAIP